MLDLLMSNEPRSALRARSAAARRRRFRTRSVTTKLRLRDGESHLLAGLLQDDERRSMTGLPGHHERPGLRHLFSSDERR